ncbi:MAG: hypothetical protein B7733_06880 [Myxococcales bacterium FL481]|nr:MAG: hypothetical protein B7733_06880 [Myxococcales bacterium FL481]
MTQHLFFTPLLLLGTLTLHECPLDELPWPEHPDEGLFIDNITPADALPGDSVVITGFGLDAVTDVRVGDTPAQLLAIEASRLVFAVPDRLEAGSHTVYVRTVDSELAAGSLNVPGGRVISLFPEENLRGREVRINGEDLGGSTHVLLGDHVLPLSTGSFGYDPYRDLEYVIVAVPENIESGRHALQVLADTGVLSRTVDFAVVDEVPAGVLPSPKRLYREYPFPAALPEGGARAAGAVAFASGEPTHLPPATTGGGEPLDDYWVATTSGWPFNSRRAWYGGGVLTPDGNARLGSIEGHGVFRSDLGAYEYELIYPFKRSGVPTQIFTGYYTPVEPCDETPCYGSLVAYDEKGRQYSHGRTYILMGDCLHYETARDCRDRSVTPENVYGHPVCAWLTSRRAVTENALEPETHEACYATVPGFTSTCDDLDAALGDLPQLYREVGAGEFLVAEHPCVRLIADGHGGDPVPDLLNWTVCGAGESEGPAACSTH